MLLFIEECLCELEHVESQIVIGELRYPLYCILTDSLVGEFRIQERDSFLWLHWGPVSKHLIYFIHLYGPVPLDRAKEYRQALGMRLIMLSAFEEISLLLIIYLA
jgi:hypothetical protein